ncbi:MAG: hypothetical protein ACREPQ_14640 [Rhodanobacter sp.]
MRTTLSQTVACVLALACIASASADPLPAKTTIDVDSVTLHVISPQQIAQSEMLHMRLGQDAASVLNLTYNNEGEHVSIRDASYVTADGSAHPLARTAIVDRPSDVALGHAAFVQVREVHVMPPSDAIALTLTVQRSVAVRGEHARAALLLGFDESRAATAEQVQVDAMAPIKVYAGGFDGGLQQTGGWRFMEAGAPLSDTGAATLARLTGAESPRHVTVNAYTSPVGAALAYDDRTAAAVQTTLAVQNLADQIAGTSQDPREIAMSIGRWTQSHIQRIDVPLDIVSRDPRSAEEVIEDGYGSPDDMVTVMRALMLAKGLQPVPVLTSEPRPRVSLLAGINGIFSDVMLYVPQLDLYVDPSVPATSPVGATLVERANSAALVAGTNQASAYIERLPGYAADELVERTTSQLVLSEDGGAAITTRVTPAGYAAVDVQHTLYHLSAPDARNMLTNPMPGRPVPTSLELDRNAVVVPGQPYSYGASASFAGTGSLILQHAINPVHGIDDVAFSDDGIGACRPGRREESLVLWLPGGDLRNAPADATLSRDNGKVSFTQRVSRRGGKVYVNRELNSAMDPSECNLHRGEVADFAHQLRDLLNQPISLGASAAGESHVAAVTAPLQ